MDLIKQRDQKLMGAVEFSLLEDDLSGRGSLPEASAATQRVTVSGEHLQHLLKYPCYSLMLLHSQNIFLISVTYKNMHTCNRKKETTHNLLNSRNYLKEEKKLISGDA